MSGLINMKTDDSFQGCDGSLCARVQNGGPSVCRPIAGAEHKYQELFLGDDTVGCIYE